LKIEEKFRVGVKIRVGRVTRTTHIFLFGLIDDIMNLSPAHEGDKFSGKIKIQDGSEK
jgi:hypothetical protein